jgi:hypothetical protein
VMTWRDARGQAECPVRSAQSCTFCSEVAMSVPCANEAVTVDAEVLDVAVVDRGSSMPGRARSGC